MKYKVLKEYIDKMTKEKHFVGEVVDLSLKRAKILMGANPYKTKYVEEMEETIEE